MDNMLRVIPVNCIRIKAPKNATGSPIAVRKADLKSRKRASIIRTIISPMMPLLTMVLNLCCTQYELSLVT